MTGSRRTLLAVLLFLLVAWTGGLAVGPAAVVSALAGWLVGFHLPRPAASSGPPSRGGAGPVSHQGPLS